MLTKRALLRTVALSAIASMATAARPVKAQTGADRPGFFGAKDIAEAGFIYGLPIVANYGVMYEYAVDRSSGQFKAPFNQIANASEVFTYKDTAIPTPNSDTPYSIVWMDLRAEPIILSVPAVDPKRYYSVQLCDGNTYNYGYIGTRATGSEAGDYMVVGPDWKGATPAKIKKVFRSSTQFLHALMPQHASRKYARHAMAWRDGGVPATVTGSTAEAPRRTLPRMLGCSCAATTHEPRPDWIRPFSSRGRATALSRSAMRASIQASTSDSIHAFVLPPSFMGRGNLPFRISLFRCGFENGTPLGRSSSKARSFLLIGGSSKIVAAQDGASRTTTQWRLRSSSQLKCRIFICNFEDAAIQRRDRRLRLSLLVGEGEFASATRRPNP